MNALIETRHLSVLRGSHAVLSDLNIKVAEGEFIAIVGRSGVGKSTLLHTLAGHLPFSGEMNVPSSIGMVFQNFAVFPWLTAGQNIGFGLQMDAVAKIERVSECLRLAGLEDKAEAYPPALSGGQQQRIAIARAIAHKPDVLLMDEPFGSLDAYTREQMQDWLNNVQKNYKTTVLMVTHSIEEALVLADRILVLRGGKIVDEFSDFRPSLHGIQRKFSTQFLQMREIITKTI